MTDEIRELLGRYATASLTAEEQKRLFDAALDDQELFDELAQEQSFKQLLDEPGARLRLLRALEPPKRNSGWIFGIAATAALSAVLIVVLMRPAQKPQPQPQPQVAAVEAPKPAEIAQVPPSKPQAVDAITSDRKEPVVKKVREKKEAAEPQGQPGGARPAAARQLPAQQSNQPALDSALKQSEQAQAAPPPSPAQNQQVQVQAQAAAPQNLRAKTIAPASRLVSLPAVGFHYSLVNPGHLTIIPANDGFLSVKTADGKDIYVLQRCAAGIVIDIPLGDATSVIATFSDNNTAVTATPTQQTTPEGDIQAQGSVAIQLKIK